MSKDVRNSWRILDPATSSPEEWPVNRAHGLNILPSIFGHRGSLAQIYPHIEQASTYPLITDTGRTLSRHSAAITDSPNPKHRIALLQGIASSHLLMEGVLLYCRTFRGCPSIHHGWQVSASALCSLGT